MADMRSYDPLDSHYRAASGRIRILSGTVTRPNDTTQYAAGDQVAGSTSAPVAIEFPGAGVYTGAGGLVLTAQCVSSANQATKPNLRLYLFRGSPTLNNDNAPWNPSDADVKLMAPGGEIWFTDWIAGGTSSGTAGNAFAYERGLNIGYRCNSGTSIWGALTEEGTYTPVASEEFVVDLTVQVD